MPALFICEKCGTRSWNRTPSSAGSMLSRSVLRKGTICPVCGHDLKTGAIGDDDESTTSESTKPETPTSE